MKLSEKTILITGGTSGIGWELAKRLKSQNNQVILLGRDQRKLEEAKSKGFQTFKCDLSDVRDIEAAALFIQNEYPGIDVLFNNAGVQFNYDFTNAVIPLEKIQQEININLSGPLLLTQLLIPLLSTSKEAMIVNTTSGLGFFPKSDGLVYSASKAALHNFTVGLRYGLKKTPIKVIEFIPPVTATPMTAKRTGKKMSIQALIDIALPQIEKGNQLVTVNPIRLFRWIAFLLPNLAHRILSKGSK